MNSGSFFICRKGDREVKKHVNSINLFNSLYSDNPLQDFIRSHRGYRNPALDWIRTEDPHYYEFNADDIPGNEYQTKYGTALKFPKAPGRIYSREVNRRYRPLEFVYLRKYLKEKKQTRCKKTVIGQWLPDYPDFFIPNEQYDVFFDREGNLKYPLDSKEIIWAAEYSKKTFARSELDSVWDEDVRAVERVEQAEQELIEETMAQMVESEEEAAAPDEGEPAEENGAEERPDEEELEPDGEPDNVGCDGDDEEPYEPESDEEYEADGYEDDGAYDEETDEEDDYEDQDDDDESEEEREQMALQEINGRIQGIEMLEEQVKQLDRMLYSISQSIYEQSRKHPETPVSAFKIRKINEVLKDIQELMRDTPWEKRLELIEGPGQDEDGNPTPGMTYSDVDILLDPYSLGMDWLSDTLRHMKYM